MQPLAEKADHHVLRLGLYAPDGVQPVLKRGEYTRGAEQQGDKANGRRNADGVGSCRVLEQALNRLSPSRSDQPFYLGHHLPARRIRSENGAGNRDDDNEERREREHCIVRERRGQTKRVVFRPGRQGLAQQAENRLVPQHTSKQSEVPE